MFQCYSLWFAFPWWLVMLSIFSYICWSSAYCDGLCPPYHSPLTGIPDPESVVNLLKFCFSHKNYHLPVYCFFHLFTVFAVCFLLILLPPTRQNERCIRADFLSVCPVTAQCLKKGLVDSGGSIKLLNEWILQSFSISTFKYWGIQSCNSDKEWLISFQPIRWFYSARECILSFYCRGNFCHFSI